MRRLILITTFATLAFAQGTKEGPGVGREQMWPAPTANDWAKPCLITWQRTWADALAVSKKTGKPILICINMDGEIASEHYAGVRYREADIAKLYEPYVTVIASTYRHTPRDFDDQGRRIPCPRFGGVTCGEHISIEPPLFEKYMDGQRVAPRHICIDLNGKEVYDVYYRNDTHSVFADVRDKKPADEARPNLVRGDRPLLERVGSQDVRDRNVVEKAYREGDQAQRQAILDAAKRHAEKGQLDLLRMAIFGLDLELSKSAREALAKTNDAAATSLVSDALRVPMEDQQRTALIAALERMGGKSPLARWLAGVHKGLGGESKSVKLSGWAEPRGAMRTAAGGGGRYAAAGAITSVENKARAVAERPEDPKSRLELAEATLALALAAPKTYASNPRMARLAARHLYRDAQTYALEAEKLGEKGWRVHAVIALALYYGGGDKKLAYERAAKAVPDVPPGDSGWASMAVVTIFAEGRFRSIKAAVKANEPWPPVWLSDLHAAYKLLLRHPLGTDRQVVWHYDFLDWMGIRHRASSVLRAGLRRFPASAALHKLYRDRLLRWAGANTLEEAYKRFLGDQPEPARVASFAGEASVLAAEQHRKVQRWDRAIASYARAIAYFEQVVAKFPKVEDRFDAPIALALAGSARVHYQAGDNTAALDAIVASFKRDPMAAGTRDGPGFTPGETAQMLRARLKKNNDEEGVRRLDAALATIDPKLLRPDIGISPPRPDGDRRGR